MDHLAITQGHPTTVSFQIQWKHFLGYPEYFYIFRNALQSALQNLNLFSLACVAGSERGGGGGFGQKGGSKSGAVERALASHQCGPGSNPGVDAICGLSLLLVLSLAPRGFSPGTPVFPSPQKPTFPNSNSTRNQVDEEPLCGCATCKSLFIYLFIYLGGGRKARKRGKGKGAPYQLPSIPLNFFHSSLSPTFFEACYAG